MMNASMSMQHLGGSGSMSPSRKFFFFKLEALRSLLIPFLILESVVFPELTVVPYSTTNQGYQRTV